MMSNFLMELVAKKDLVNSLGSIFTAGKVYKAKELGNTLMIKDDLKCTRHFYEGWKKDKVFNEYFDIKENTNGEDSVHPEGTD